ncbi:MAG: site-specific DNA-methyltransferase [Actinobacteria bacterium]|nr:site-specific DNA-methyltransferase [Actinomycetota bacterium]
MSGENMIDRIIKEKSRLTKEEWREYTKSIWSIKDVRSKLHPAPFPEEIPYRLIKMFTFVGETVLDPFAGIGTTMIAARKLQRNSISIDINPKYVEIIKKQIAQQTLVDDNTKHEVYCRDSRDLSFIKDNSIDLVVTSPPYWNKVKYCEEDPKMQDLGNIEDYEIFVREVLKVFRECYRVLKPGRRLCVVTANVHGQTKNGLVRYPLASDYIIGCRKLGFSLVGEVIWSKEGTGSPWGASGDKRPIFGSYPYPPNFLFFNLHEYILIFRKDPRKNKEED